MNGSNLTSILNELGLPTSARDTGAMRAVSKSRLLELMRNDDSEVLGAIYTFLDSERSKLLEPPLAFSEYQAFLLRYYEKCLLEDPDGR